MNRRALFKSIVASVCIGTAQQLGVKDAPPEFQRGYLTHEELDRIYKRLIAECGKPLGAYHTIDHLPPPRYNYSKTNPDYRDA